MSLGARRIALVTCASFLALGILVCALDVTANEIGVAPQMRPNDDAHANQCDCPACVGSPGAAAAIGEAPMLMHSAFTHLPSVGTAASAAAATAQNRQQQQGETTFVLVKPDGVQRGLVGEIISRWERRGFRLLAIKTDVPARELAEQHYAEHAGKPFFADLVGFLTSGPVVAMVRPACVRTSHVRHHHHRHHHHHHHLHQRQQLPPTVCPFLTLRFAQVWQGDDVVAISRLLIGATHPRAAQPGTVRGDWARDALHNVVHAADSVASAQREMALWFADRANP